jgi:hypothetical protein
VPSASAKPKGTGASGSSSSASAEKKPVKKSAAKGKKKQKGATGETFMRLGRGIKAGSVTVGKYGKKALTAFDTFATSQVEEDQSDIFFKRIVDRLGLTGKLKFSGFIIGSIILLIVMLVLFNNTSLEVEHVTVSVAGLDSDLEGYTICLLSDLHGREFGTKQATLLRSINGEEYDLMLLAGDMIGSLEHIGSRYQKEMDRNIASFTNALEPILIVAIAIVVGFIAISILTAVFEVSATLG